MTEDQWETCTDPAVLLHFLRSRLNDRKLRLFACACCQRLWPLLPRGPAREAVRLAQRYADGEAGVDELKAGWSAVRKSLSTTPLGTKWEEALMAALHSSSAIMSGYSASHAARSAALALDEEW